VLIEICIAIDISSLGETFDPDFDFDFDFDFDRLGPASLLLHCKDLRHLHRDWPLEDV